MKRKNNYVVPLGASLMKWQGIYHLPQKDITSLIGWVLKFALSKLEQTKTLARFFCQNLNKYLWGGLYFFFLNSNQMGVKIYGCQNFGRQNLAPKQLGSTSALFGKFHMHMQCHCSAPVHSCVLASEFTPVLRRKQRSKCMPCPRMLQFKSCFNSSPILAEYTVQTHKNS